MSSLLDGGERRNPVMEKQKREEIMQALNVLGVTGKIRIVCRRSTIAVYVNGKYFRIYDAIRHTFVD